MLRSFLRGYCIAAAAATNGVNGKGGGIIAPKASPQGGPFLDLFFQKFQALFGYVPFQAGLFAFARHNVQDQAAQN